jgi:hypothetical protein
MTSEVYFGVWFSSQCAITLQFTGANFCVCDWDGSVRSVCIWVRDWNTEFYVGTKESFKMRGPMTLHVAVVLRGSCVEQTVCFAFI